MICAIGEKGARIIHRGVVFGLIKLETALKYSGDMLSRGVLAYHQGAVGDTRDRWVDEIYPFARVSAVHVWDVKRR